MKLNHLNLSVDDVLETKQFLEKYFGFRNYGPEGNEHFAMVTDDTGIALSLLKESSAEPAKYPPGFHIGFIQDSEEKVNEINQQLKDDGFDVRPPRIFHGSWTFYFRAPGGFLIEVLAGRGFRSPALDKENLERENAV